MHPREFVESLESRHLLSGNGLVGYYYNTTSMTNLVMTRNDSAINFNFGSSAPVPQMGSKYSIEWQAQILPPTTGVYTFYVNATDGVRLSVRGTQIIDRWSDASGEIAGTIPLAGGQIVDLTLDYYNDTNNGNVQLSWSAPGLGKQIIPNSAYYNSYGANYTFANPISPNGADPWVQFENGEYYYCYSDGGALYVSASSTLQGIATASATKIFAPPSGQAYSYDLWAPELHYISGKWYVYFAADNSPGDNDAHRMYVLESTGTNPQGLYNFEGEIKPTADTGIVNPGNTHIAIDHWAIDGTVVTIGSQNYFVWSGWDGTDPNGQSQVPQNLYIALMSSPTTISGGRHLLSQPTYSWEQNGLPINEGPEELVGPTGGVFVIYSASGYWTNQYCLGQLAYNGAGNPLSQSSWAKNSNPVFQADAYAVGVGHASFTISPDGAQNWIVYADHNTTGTFTGVRDIRIQQFTFNADGSPNFGSPLQPGVPLPEPSGTPHLTTNFNYPVYPSAVAVALSSVSSRPVTATPIVQHINTPIPIVKITPIPLAIARPTLPPPIAPFSSTKSILILRQMMPVAGTTMTNVPLLRSDALNFWSSAPLLAEDQRESWNNLDVQNGNS